MVSEALSSEHLINRSHYYAAGRIPGLKAILSLLDLSMGYFNSASKRMAVRYVTVRRKLILALRLTPPTYLMKDGRMADKSFESLFSLAIDIDA